MNFVGINGSTLNVTADVNTATNVGKPVASVGVFSVSAQDTATVNAKVINNTISSINGYQGVNIAAENNATTLKVEVDNNDINGLQARSQAQREHQRPAIARHDHRQRHRDQCRPDPQRSPRHPAPGVDHRLDHGQDGQRAGHGRNTGVDGNGFGETFQVLLSGSGTFSTTMNLTVDGNSFDNVSGTIHSGYLEAAWSLGAVCLDLTTNNSNGQPIDVVKNGQSFVIRNRDSVGANNPLATFVFSPNLASFGTQSGACPQPTLPPI